MSGRNPALTDWATPGRLWEKSNISTVCGGSNEPQPFTKGIYQFVLNNGVFADVSYTGWKSVATLEAFKMLARLRPPPTTSMAQFWGLYHLSQHCPTTPTTLQVGKVKQLIIKNLSRRWDQITNASAQLLLSSFLPQKIRRKKNNKKKQEFTKIVSWIEGVPNTKAFRVRESVAKLWDLP